MSNLTDSRRNRAYQVGFLADNLLSRIAEYKYGQRFTENELVAITAALEFIDQVKEGGRPGFYVGRRTTPPRPLKFGQEYSSARVYAYEAWSAIGVAKPTTEEELHNLCERYRTFLKALAARTSSITDPMMEEIKGFFLEIARRTLGQTQTRGLH